MEIAKRIVRAAVYAIVCGFGGGIGGMVGSAPTAFTQGIRFGGVMSGMGIIVQGVLYIAEDSEEYLESVMETFLLCLGFPVVASVAIFFILFSIKYALRGASMGIVRGARGDALGGGLGGALNGISGGALWGFIFYAILSALLILIEKIKKNWYLKDWKYYMESMLICAILGLIIGTINGVEKYASKSIRKNDSLKKAFQSTFNYALRGTRLEIKLDAKK
ncbi:MAG: hypothetical protein LBQ03_01190 [Puniceicoccales bacterium]|jgi:glucan phosphoethanolaminetransferase (alkaline phosphatase superfamily)|nr:hypothetical protein [Puniceicoccales bacterium]